MEVTETETRDARPLWRLDAVWRGRRIAYWNLCRQWPEFADTENWWLFGAYTHPLYRRRGVSSLLLRKALEVARGEGATEVFVAVAADNVANLTLMQQAGFSCVTDGPVVQKVRASNETLPEDCAPLLLLKVTLEDEAVAG